MFNLFKKIKKEKQKEVFKTLSTKEGYEEILQESREHPVGIIKHSIMCGVSSAAFVHLGDALKSGELKLPVYKLIIQDSRDLSNYIAQETGEKHESPQFLLFVDKKVVFQASHNAINTDLIKSYLK